MATVTLQYTAVGLQEVQERAANKVVPDTYVLHAYSSTTATGFAAVIGDVTESPNTTPQDVNPASLTSVASDPTVVTSYSGTISIPVTVNTAERGGYYLTNQAGTKLIALGATPSVETLAAGRSFDITGFELVIQNAP